MVYLRDGVLRAEYHGRNGDNVRELDVIVGVVFDNGKWREVDDNAMLPKIDILQGSLCLHYIHH